MNIPKTLGYQSTVLIPNVSSYRESTCLFTANGFNQCLTWCRSFVNLPVQVTCNLVVSVTTYKRNKFSIVQSQLRCSRHFKVKEQSVQKQQKSTKSFSVGAVANLPTRTPSQCKVTISKENILGND